MTADVTMAQAETIMQASVRKARELDLLMNIAVVDVGGHLKSFVRMDGAWLGSIDIAIKKARTARLFDMPSGDLGPMAQPGQPLYQIEVSNDGLITFPGGIPLTNGNGQVVGAVGASGSTVDNDQAVAHAGVSAFDSAAAR
ncbi:heme-binding protein [Saccharopolyspora sp. K220]|uniref:GlcG/HbpS family heme-binding protein n=1 Tax=Saccharopolyspora soli TaxID=2926618 RepID=UPI001F5A9F1B|nr:heme-binding protein [Saccharopolyspora soli]MCI2423206.1 heme-binding protein [Saccharopolyspora soli]